MPPHSRRFRLRWYALAAASAAVALGTGLFGWYQVAQAHSINHASLRVHGRVAQVPNGVGTYSQVEYTVRGRTQRVADITLPPDATVGDRVCLEVAVGDPTAARVCGERYPQALGIGLARTALPISLLLLLLALARLRRLRAARRAELALSPRRSRRRRRMVV